MPKIRLRRQAKQERKGIALETSTSSTLGGSNPEAAESPEDAENDRIQKDFYAG